MSDHAGEASPRELEIERLNRLYAALSHINQAIVWARSRDELFQRVCDVLVQEGGFEMAWIGWYDPETSRLRPVTRSGDTDGFLDRIRIYADDRPEGRGPSGQAFRENRPSICNDVFADPATIPWRSQLAGRDLRASAVLPIRCNGEPRATLSVYANRPNFFRSKEVALLSEAAVELSFALDNLASADEQRRAEAVVKRFVAIVESTDDAIVSNTLDGTITSWNRAAEQMFGYRAEEVLGRSIELILPPDRLDEEARILGRIRSGEHVKQLETERRCKDGRLIPVAVTFSPIWGPDETTGGTKIVGVSKIARDITERRQAEAVVDREQRFSKSLIESMPGIFYLYDQTGRFRRWNRNFETVSGYGADEIARMHPLDFFDPDVRPLLEQRIGHVFETGGATVEAPFRSKDGRTTPYFFTGKRVVYDGAPCLVGVGVDIAERKRAEQALSKSEERYRSTLDNILEGCQLLGFDWRYLYLNDAAAVQNRRPNAELIGRTMPESWPGIEATDVFAMLRRCAEERVALHAETEFTFPDGAKGWFDVRAQPVPEGVFVLSIDISERKAAEKALRELNESLEHKVAERTRELAAARERAEAADRIKSAFLATMSHELRTPLNSILGFTGIMLQGLAGPLAPEQSKQLGMVRGSARHLLELINDVLDISKIEAGQLEVRFAPFDLRAAIEHAVAVVTPLAEKKALALHVVVPDALEPLESDRKRVQQILLNLLNNAIKFTEAGTVTLTAEVTAAHETPVVRLQVIDTGIGMKPEHLALLFQPFRQIDSGLQRKHEGTGLGLAICRRLAGLLGGTIQAESVWGRGSVMTVTLPLKRVNR